MLITRSYPQVQVSPKNATKNRTNSSHFYTHTKRKTHPNPIPLNNPTPPFTSPRHQVLTSAHQVRCHRQVFCHTSLPLPPPTMRTHLLKVVLMRTTRHWWRDASCWTRSTVTKIWQLQLQRTTQKQLLVQLKVFIQLLVRETKTQQRCDNKIQTVQKPSLRRLLVSKQQQQHLIILPNSRLLQYQLQQWWRHQQQVLRKSITMWVDLFLAWLVLVCHSVFKIWRLLQVNGFNQALITSTSTPTGGVILQVRLTSLPTATSGLNCLTNSVLFFNLHIPPSYFSLFFSRVKTTPDSPPSVVKVHPNFTHQL